MTYYTKAKQMWYQPVFQVITHDGQEVWRRRCVPPCLPACLRLSLCTYR